ncbi:MAG: class I SAM-dependent methyltransferase [Armatimonadetes bacterium]|nr:class I SAM-dependent methyltransferase [Armatimonadota bacterium]
MNLKKDYWHNLKKEEALIVKSDLSIIFRRNAIINKITHKEGMLLDLGCGIEFFLYKNLKNFKRIGLDLAMSSFYAMQAQELICGKGNFINADARALPFKNESFDVVISSNSFDHLTEPIVCLKEIYRILKPDGEFIVCLPNKLNGGLKAHKHIFSLYTPDKLKEISKNLFNIESIEYILLFYSLLWNKTLFILNILYSLYHKITFQKNFRKHLYDTKLYINFCRIFKNFFDILDISLSKIKPSFINKGYFIAKLIKK